MNTQNDLAYQIADAIKTRYPGLDIGEDDLAEPIRKFLAANCPECGGSGAVDSGGFAPWGEPINVPCPMCSRDSAAK